MSGAVSEHVGYLTLPGRNNSYRKAIAATIREGDLVADLGCGVGVLGLFCLEAGARHCWGIDSSDAIYLARDSMKRAGVDDRYTCIADSTFRIALPELVDVIICDHVGFFGFDYGIIAMMRDARQRLLKPGGRMIPEALDLMIAPISSDACLEKAAEWGHALVPDAFRWIEAAGRNMRYSHELAPDDLLGAPVRLGHVSFAEDEPEFFRFEAVLTADRAGRFDGLGGWFDCQLAGDVRMTNSPLDPANIMRGQAFLPALESFDVAEGDEIRVSVRFRADDYLISWTIHPPGGAKPQKLSTFNSLVLTPAALVRDSGLPLTFNRDGAARAFVLAQVDGTRTAEDIAAIVLAEMPDFLPTEQAIREFVKAVLSSNCLT